MHVFVPTGGEQAGRLYDHLQDVWARCADRLGMHFPIDVLGVPATPPRRHQPETTRIQEPIAAQRRIGDGVFQCLLRREHDVLCLSVMLAPPPEAGVSWRELQALWAQLSEPVPDGLLGWAELYLSRLADPGPERVESTAELGGVCRELMPAPIPHRDFDASGTTTPSGYAMWEADPDDIARVARRIVLVAPHQRDPEFSAWVWTRGGRHGMGPAPFTRYLMHAAKLRYHLRVWSGGEPVRALRRDTDQVLAELTALLAAGGATGAGGPADAAGVTALPAKITACAAALRRETGLLATTATQLKEIRRSVDLATSNMAAYADPGIARAVRAPAGQPGVSGSGQPWPRPGGVFTDDLALAKWFGNQLDDDHFYVTAALERARATLDLATTPNPAPTTTPTRTTAPGPVTVDLALTPMERTGLVRELARAFPTDAAAQAVLSAVGLERSRRPNLGNVPPAWAWEEILAECEHGAIRTPYRRLLAAALALYPYNRTFRGLAHLHGVEPSAHSADPDRDRR
ncbi:hypothetical protein UG55_100857 [Frankia sp. EI5c]|nr:hypothetical protein UG55_100857 [Frankia sp. EI5c]